MAVAVEAREPDRRPWAIYARLSKAQDGGLEKVEHQVQLCTDYAKSRGLDVGAVFTDDSLSAWKKRVRRPDWDELMRQAGSGQFAGVLVYAVDRFTRRPKDLEALIELADEHGVAIDGPRSGRLDLTTATGRQQARWMALQAASESDNTSERIKSTLGRKMREGKPMGAGRSYGFEVGGQKVRPAEARVIREVARRMLKGESTLSICRDLNAHGLRSARDSEFTPRNLVPLMVRPRNAGLIVHRGDELAAICDDKGKAIKPILDRGTYDDVVAMVNARRRGRPPTGRYLLTGLMRCGKDDRPMSGTRVRRGAATVRVYHSAASTGGCSRTILADPTEAIVADAMTALLGDPEEMAGVSEKQAELSEARAEQVAKIDALDELLADLEVKRVMGEVRPRAYEASKSALDRQLTQAQAVLDSIGHLRAPLAVDVAAEWAEATDEEKRRLIGALITITIAEHGGYSGRFFRPERVVIERRS